jgi:hypothetical protein
VRVNKPVETMEFLVFTEKGDNMKEEYTSFFRPGNNTPSAFVSLLKRDEGRDGPLVILYLEQLGYCE